MPLPSSGIITMAQIQAEFGGANPISLSEYYKGGAYISANDAAPNVPASGAISVSNFYGAAKNVVGQVAYTTPGTFSWVCPAGVTSVCVVCVGAGGAEGVAGGQGRTSPSSGGNLAYGNNIPVVPGTTYTVKVGGTAANDYAATRSYFISTAHLMAGGGLGCNTAINVAAASENNAGTYLSGGGKGGNGGGYEGAGGGAGGYSGNGGYGGSSQSAGGPGSGGGGGGGGGRGAFAASPGGGGVGILGEGASGAAGPYGGAMPTGGSGGASGAITTGGAYGGGSGTNPDNTASGGNGAVRIIWGSGRAFPSTNTGNL